MMNLRKNPEKDLRRLRGLFFQIGLLTALLLTVSAFEWRTQEIEPVVDVPEVTGSDGIIVPVTVIEEPKPPKPIRINPVPVIEPEAETEIDIQDILDWETPQITTDPEVLPQLDDEPIDKVEDYTDEMPEPVGGYDAFYKYVSKNVEYTQQARRLNVQGKVFVQFVVDKDGSITEVKIARGIGAGLDEEALAVMQNSPKWNPGRKEGRRVKVRMIIPIHFKLQ